MLAPLFAAALASTLQPFGEGHCLDPARLPDGWSLAAAGSKGAGGELLTRADLSSPLIHSLHSVSLSGTLGMRATITPSAQPGQSLTEAAIRSVAKPALTGDAIGTMRAFVGEHGSTLYRSGEDGPFMECGPAAYDREAACTLVSHGLEPTFRVVVQFNPDHRLYAESLLSETLGAVRRAVVSCS